MDDFSSTQLCESISYKSNELSQIQTPGTGKKKQIGTLKIKDEEYPIYIGINTVGRNDSNQIVIKDVSVSKNHAEIEGRKRSCFVTDLKSLNGTFDQYKERYLEHKAYMLTSGATIKFGQVEATFKHFRYEGNFMKTPVTARINKIIASTPQSVLNSTHDDSSVVYGTQAAQEISSPCTSKFVRPKNLQTEFSKIDDELCKNEDGAIKNSTENISSIHETVTQVFNVKIQIQDKSLEKNMKIQDSEEFELFSHLPYNDVPTTSSDKIEEEPTQAFVPKKRSKISDNSNIVPDSDSDADSDSYSDHVRKISVEANKIFEQETQPIASVLTSKEDKKNASNLLKNHLEAKDSDTDEEGIFQEQTQVCDKKQTPKLDKIQNISKNSSTIHQEITQVFEERQNQSTDRDDVSAKYLKVKDSDNEVFKESIKKVPDKEDNVHEDATQVFSTKSNDVHEVKTQAFLSPSSRIPLKSKNTRKVFSKVEDSDTDEEGIFEEETQKVSTNLDNIHEANTQATTGLKSKDEDSETDEEGVFNEPTQKISTKSDKIHEEKTQAIPLSSGSLEIENSNNQELDTNRMFMEPTQKFTASSPKECVPRRTNKILEDSSIITNDEDVFAESNEQIYDAADNIHKDETQVFLKSDNIHENITQAFLSPSTKILHRTSKEDSKEYSTNFETDEIDFEGPTQKVDRVHEDATQVYSTKSDNIHQDKTQPFLSPSGTQTYKSALKTYSRKSHKKYSVNFESDEIDYEGPTQKVSDNIHQDETQVFANSGKKFKNLETNEIDYEGPTQQISDNIHQDETQVFANSGKKSKNLETGEIDYEGPTQKVSDNIHQDETQVFANSGKKFKNLETNEIDYEGPTQQISDNIHQDETQVFANSGKQSKNLETDEIDYEGPTQKLITKSVKINEAVTKNISHSSEKEDSDTDEEGIFEEPKKVSTKSDGIHEANTQLVMSHQSEKDESDTDEEGVFEGPQKVFTKSDTIHEANTQVVMSHLSKKDESDTDEEGVFQASTHETSTIHESETLKIKTVIASSNTTENENVNALEVENSKTPLIDNSKTSEIENSKLQNSSTEEEEEEEELKVLNSRKHITPSLKESDQVHQSIASTSRSPLKKVSKNKKIISNCETDDAEISENETKNSAVKTDGFATPVVAEQNSSLSKQTSMEIDDFTGFSPRRSRRSTAIHEKVENIIQKCKKNSKIKGKSENNSSYKSESSFLKNQQEFKSTIKLESNVETSENKNSKIQENSDAEVESIFKNQEDRKIVDDVKQTRHSQRNIQKATNSNPSTSKQQKSETKNDILEKEDTSLKEKLKTKRTSQSSIRERKISKTENDTNVEQEKISTQKSSPRKSLRLDRTTKEDKESVDLEKVSTPKKQISESPGKKMDKTTNSELSDSEQKGKKKTWKFILPLSSDKSTVSSKNNPSSSADYEMNSQLASVENLEYETSATQPIDDIETNKTQDKKINPKSPKKEKSTNKSSVRRSVRLNDTVEDNLNEMFEGASEEIEEPHQMLTQQLKNILEASQFPSDEPSTSATRDIPKESKKSTGGSFKLEKSPKVGKFHFKSNDFQVVSNEKTCESFDESDDEFVPFMPKKKFLNSLISSSFKGLSHLARTIALKGNQSPSTSSEMSFNDSPVKMSPSHSNSKSLQRNDSRRKKRLKSIENFNMPEEVEKQKSFILDDDSDDSDFEDLKRMANRVLEVKSVYVDNRSAIKLKTLQVRLQRVNIDKSSDFQVNIGNQSPRMSKLNIQVEKPLKKRALRISDNEKVEESLIQEKNKRAKQDENSSQEGVVNSKPLKTRGRAKKSTSDVSSTMEDSEVVPNSNVTEENLKVPVNLKSRRTKRANSSKSDSINSSISLAEDSENIPSPAKKTLKVPLNSKSKRTKRTNSPKIDVNNSSSSMAEDSKDISNTAKESLKVPLITKSKRTKRTNSSTIDDINSSSSMKEDSENIPNLNLAKETSKAPINSRRRIAKRSAIDAASSSRAIAEEDSENISNSNQMKESIKVPVNPRKRRITKRGKVPDISPSSSFVDNETSSISKVDKTLNTDLNSSTASTSKTNLEDISNSSQKKEILKMPANPRKGRAKKTKNEEEKTMLSASSSSSFIETPSSTLEETVITEPKKTRGRKPKTAKQAESSRLENLSASSTMLSFADSDLNSSTASTPSRAKRSRLSSPLKHKVLFTGIPVKDYQKQLTKLGLNETEDVNKCSILVTDKVRRTFKFLCAISRGIPILSVKWITDSAKKSNIQELEDYIINDPAAESKFNFNLKESLQKAKDQKMLEGYTVVLTPNITAPPVAELKEMVTASGGKAVLRLPTKWVKDTIIVSNEQDSENAKKFMAKAPITVSLHSTEFLLTGILKQEVDLKSYLLKIN